MNWSWQVGAAVAAATAMTVLSACGGGGDSQAGTDTSVAAVLAALETTNVSSIGQPWTVGPIVLAPGVLKRWVTPIKVKTKGDTRAVAALDEIERQLGMTVFDRTSIANELDDNITQGIVISIGTTPTPLGGSATYACAATQYVSAGDLVSASGVMKAKVTIHIDGSVCKASQSRVIHEFGHALGMGPHYAGFEEGDAVAEVSPLFWRVLKTIYTNAPGTPRGSIVVPG